MGIYLILLLVFLFKRNDIVLMGSKNIYTSASTSNVRNSNVIKIQYRKKRPLKHWKYNDSLLYTEILKGHEIIIKLCLVDNKNINESMVPLVPDVNE